VATGLSIAFAPNPSSCPSLAREVGSSTRRRSQIDNKCVRSTSCHASPRFWMRARHRDAEVCALYQLSRIAAVLDACEASRCGPASSSRVDVARKATTFSRSCSSDKPGNNILTPGKNLRGALK